MTSALLRAIMLLKYRPTILPPDRPIRLIINRLSITQVIKPVRDGTPPRADILHAVCMLTSESFSVQLVTMFIRVKYGDDETLLCNPSCSIINLLSSIRTRSGHTDDEVVIDLTDETGFSYIIRFPKRRLQIVSQRAVG